MFYEYDRNSAVSYAKRWALDRNPKYKDYELWGGNCTNFISQSIHAGLIPFDYEGNNIMKQWYWHSDISRTPSWTGSEPFYQYLINNNNSNTSNFGVYARLAEYDELEIGDVIQLVENNKAYHTMIITDVIFEDGEIYDYLISQNTYDLLDYPLSLKVGERRYIKILGYYK